MTQTPYNSLTGRRLLAQRLFSRGRQMSNRIGKEPPMLISFPLNVAIIDDDVVQTKLISGFLKDFTDINIEVFNDPVAAMKEIEGGKFKVVITDLKMDGMQGDDLVRRCQEIRQGIQCVVVTGTDHLMSAIRCFNAGAHRVLRKPINKTDLVTAVRISVDHFKAFNDTVGSIKAKKAS
jgi:two-component system, NtrC family, response regulator HydG